MEDIEKRLKAIEDSIRELRATDLLIAKLMVSSMTSVLVNIAGRTTTGEEGRRFREVFAKKQEASKEELEGAKTLAEAFNVLFKFDGEIADFIKATKVDTADKAMEIAHSFIKKYSPVALPLKAVKDGDVWLVDIDVGPLVVKIAKVKVDARTGDILSYEIPTRDSKGS